MGDESRQGRIGTLTDREKQTLRLLLKGHDAKSIARTLDLSVHTINERLRDARRKLAVASSREAARLLAEAEQPHPEQIGDDIFGVTDAGTGVLPAAAAVREGRTLRIAWLSGGMFVMSLLVAAFAVVAVINSGKALVSPPPAAPEEAGRQPSDPAVERSARDWLKLADDGQWDASWKAASADFRSQVTAPRWQAMSQSVRAPLGAPTSRRFLGAVHHSSLPGAPAGEYEVLQFRTDFTNKAGAIETVTLVREGTGWRMAGYFIR